MFRGEEKTRKPPTNVSVASAVAGVAAWLGIRTPMFERSVVTELSLVLGAFTVDWTVSELKVFVVVGAVDPACR